MKLGVQFSINPITLIFVAAFAFSASLTAQTQQVFSLWLNSPPGETKQLPPEKDTTTPDSEKVAGRRLIRLGNVSHPTATVFPAPKDKATGASVIVCPGGGHYILAWDLEGTEVATWLNSIGVTAVVLKYRVPARDKEKRWMAAVQDAQRCVSLVRAKADEFEIDPERIGILGFSAGGETAALTALFSEQQYAQVDSYDRFSQRPNFAALIYPGGLTNKDHSSLRDYIPVTKEAPPMFFAHAQEDGVRVENSIHLFLALRQLEIPAEMHIYSEGGHGYGLRETAQPVTTWHHRCAAWMRASGFLTQN
jgi:acetyl esterase/lipase